MRLTLPGDLLLKAQELYLGSHDGGAALQPCSASLTNYVLLQGDGKVLIGGQFSFFNDVPGHAHFARLNLDGSLDTYPAWGGGPDGAVTSISFQSDGKIVISGSLEHYNWITRPYLVRLSN